MSVDPNPADAEAIFTAAVEKHSPAEVIAYLDEVCGDNAELRAHVESLLQSHRAASGLYFDSPLFATVTKGNDAPMTEGPGTVIGRYKLLQEIGEGGFGVVYMAEQQEPVKRKVALKLVKPGMDTREIIARFESERQALALMDHPGVAKVLDAGATELGRPYFVMELVHGVPITDFCDKRKLSTSQRLRLFADVCRAVQHAHQKGIIHRDLKPSNIMITMLDDIPVVKVIDFGVSKALSQQLTEKTLFTAYGQMVGTPLYMSPEQAQMSGLDVDTRSDVYSLGILLYELLTGTTPFDQESMNKAGVDEWRRIIREDEPPRPSARVSTLQAEALVTVCDRRGADPRRLSQSLRGELDWIVMKALEKNRTRRYEGASGLARDIERYLNEEPIEARPPSAAYYLRKFARRNRAAMVTVGLVAATLLLGVAVSTWQAIRADAQRVRAVAAQQEANSERDRALQAEQAERRQRQRADERTEENRRLLYVADMNMAHQAWQAGDVAGMTRLLEQYWQPAEGDLRGFQWHHLWYLCERSRNTPVVDHGSRAWGMDLSPDGKMVATIGYGDFLKLWDVESLQVLEEIPTPNMLMASTAFSPDSKLLAYNSPQSTVVLHDRSTGGANRSFPARNGSFSIAFSPDGAHLAAAGFAKVVYLWEVASGRTRVLRGHDPDEYTIWKVAFSPDGRMLATAGTHKVILWDVASGKARHELTPEISLAQCVAFAPDGKTLVTGGLGGVLRYWDTESGQLRKNIAGQVPSGAGSLAYSSDGHLAVGTWDGTVVLLDARTGTRLDVLKGHQQEIFVVRFSTDNETLASASFDGTVKLWDVSVRSPVELLRHTDTVTSVAISSDDSVVVSGSAGGTVRLWDVHTGQQLAAHPLHELRIEDVAIAPNGRTAASVSYSNKAVLMDLALGKSTEFRIFTPNSVIFFPDSTTVAVGGAAGSVTLWNMNTAVSSKWPNGHTNMSRAVAISPDGNLFASGSWDNTIELRNIETSDKWTKLKQHEGTVECLAFGPDGKTLASGSADKTVILWDVDSLQPKKTLKGHTGPINSLAFSADGEILASASNDRTIRLWYLRANKEPEILPESAPVTSVAFSSDGATLISGSGQHVRLWRTAEPDELEELSRLSDLEQSARTIIEADPHTQRQTLNRLQNHLVTSASKGLLLRDLVLAASTIWRLEKSGQREQAREALRIFTKVIASSSDPRYSEWAVAWESQK